MIFKRLCAKLEFTLVSKTRFDVANFLIEILMANLGYDLCSLIKANWMNIMYVYPFDYIFLLLAEGFNVHNMIN